MHGPLTTQIRTDYYPAFDFLRGVLAITVMLDHDNLFPWDRSGSFAVDVFFALSGWLIGGILLNLKPQDLPRFYFNRAIRIWAPYYFALILLVAASLLRDPVTPKWLEFVFYKITFVFNIFGHPQVIDFRSMMPLAGTGSHFWSVNAEEQFYLLAPLVLVLLPLFGRTIIAWLAIAFVAWFAQMYASIAFGVLAAVVADRYGSFHQRYWPLILLMTAGAAAFIVHDYERAAPFAAIGIVLLLAFPGIKTKIGEIIGGMSYPLYLNHWIGVFVMNYALTPMAMRDTPTRKLLSCLFSIALAIGLFTCMDRQLLRHRAALYSPTSGYALTFLAYAIVAAGLCGALLFHTHLNR